MTDSPVVVITGAGRGIGAATANLLAERGQTVLAVDLVHTETSEAAHPVTFDVSSAEAWAELGTHLEHTYGRLDGLVHCAYTLTLAPIHEQSVEQWDRQLAVNLSPVHRSLVATYPLLASSGGSVVLVSSVHALVGIPGHPAYAASKGALVALSRQLAVEYGPQMRVNSVLPGPVLTAAWDRVDEAGRTKTAAGTTLQRLGEPREVAEAIAFLLSPAASFISGASLVVDGGMTAKKDAE